MTDRNFSGDRFVVDLIIHCHPSGLKLIFSLVYHILEGFFHKQTVDLDKKQTR